tara:strand:- start:559 stop:855 length:297 start_codon:yes stop_codon:yes gene_type:complete
MTINIYNIPQIKSVKAMPKYGLVAVDFYPFQEDLSLETIKNKVYRNNDSKNDVKEFINEYERLRNSVLIPDGEGNLYRWFFNSQENMIKFLTDKQNAN